MELERSGQRSVWPPSESASESDRGGSVMAVEGIFDILVICIGGLQAALVYVERALLSHVTLHVADVSNYDYTHLRLPEN